MHHPTLPSLQDIERQMQPHVADVAEVLRLYTDAVDKYYEMNKPFTSKDPAKDLTSFIELVGFSTITGSYYLLEKWCIHNLQVSNLAKPLAYYASKIEQLAKSPTDFKLEAGAKPYAEHLAKRLKSLVSVA
jgi:virulence-associated protein VapD